jgi:cysteinyl-tRNA synthetase
MSKSSGEFLTVSLLESKGYDPLVYRFFCLQSHYRKSLVFSYENLDNAAIAYNKLVAKIAALYKEEQGEVNADDLDALKARFTAAMDNDLNTSLAVTALYDVLKAKTNAATKLAALADFDRVLCVGLIEAAQRIVEEEKKAAEEAAARIANDPFAAYVENMIAERAAAKKAKDFARADAIRAELLEKGVTLTDTSQGTKWSKG